MEAEVAYRDEDETCDKSSDSETDSEEYMPAPIDKLGPAGRWFRHRLLSSILIGTPPLSAIQRRRTPFFTQVMKLNSFFGTEEFYTPLVVLILWIIDARLGRMLCLLMGIGFYVAGFLKETFCLPRPPSPPIIPLEVAGGTWGLPSHHAVLGVLIPWYIWFFSLLHFPLSQWAFTFVFMVIATWSVSVMFSRLYLGVHSPADIVCGGIVGCIVLALWIKVDNAVDMYISFGNNVSVQAIVYSLLLLFIHPRSHVQTNSLVETIAMVGVTVGFVMGRATMPKHSPNLKALLEISDASTPWFTFAWVALVRLCLGYALVQATRLVCKYLLGHAISSIYRQIGIDGYSGKFQAPTCTSYTPTFKLPPVHAQNNKKHPRKSRSQSGANKRKWNVGYPVKYVSYMSVGWMAISGAPLLFHSLGLTV